MNFQQEQYADLLKYVPESDMVKTVFEEVIGKKIDNWNEEILKLGNLALAGDTESLMNLLELTYLNGHNEGFIEANNEIYDPAHERC